MPDIDRTHYLLIIGANPIISHGSLMTMPDAPGRLKRGARARRQDRRHRSAPHRDGEDRERAPLHPPGHATPRSCSRSCTRLFDEGLVDLGAARELVDGLDDGAKRSRRSSRPRRSPSYCGIAAGEIRRIARELAAAESAACYGRLGTCVQEFGTLASWGCDLVNILTGNLDRPGGVMFTTPAAPLDAALPQGKGFEIGRWKSRVSGQPEVEGLIPSSTMAEEMLTPGDGPGARDDPADDQPAAQRRELERARARVRRPRLPGRDRLLHQRDDAPRARHPARRRRRPSRRATRSGSTCCRCATWRSGRGRSCRAPTDTPETWQVFSEHRRAPDGPRGMPRAGDRRLHLPAHAPKARSPRARSGRGSPSTRSVEKVDGGIGPDARRSTCCCASDRTATASAAARTG